MLIFNLPFSEVLDVFDTNDFMSIYFNNSSMNFYRKNTDMSIEIVNNIGMPQKPRVLFSVDHAK